MHLPFKFKKSVLFIYCSLLIFSLHASSSHNIIQSSIQGCMMAAVYGDALGYPAEQLNFSQQYSDEPTLTDLFNKYPNGISNFDDIACGTTMLENGRYMYTDDTGMARIVAECLTLTKQESLEHCMHVIAHKFVTHMNHPRGWAWSKRAPGNTCLKACTTIYEKIFKRTEYHQRWWYCGQEKNGGGSGAVMRTHPCIIFADDIEQAELYGVQQGLITHGAPMSSAACAAMAVGIVLACHRLNPWFIAHKMQQTSQKYDPETAALIEEAINYARVYAHTISFKKLFSQSIPVFQKFKGWNARQAIAAVIYIFLVSSSNVKNALYLGINTPGDSDTLASMAGALVGAYCGIDSLPEHWIKLVEAGEEILKLSTRMSKLINTEKFNCLSKKLREEEAIFMDSWNIE